MRKDEWTYYLKLNGFAIKFNGADLEVHADGADIALSVCVILQNKNNNNNLIKVVDILRSSCDLL